MCKTYVKQCKTYVKHMKTYENYKMYQIKVRTRQGVETVVCKSALAGGVPFVG